MRSFATRFRGLVCVAALLLLLLPGTALAGDLLFQGDPLNDALWGDSSSFTDFDGEVYYQSQGLAGDALQGAGPGLAGYCGESLGPISDPGRLARLDSASARAPATGGFTASDTYWWYFYHDHYRVLMPGDKKGPYSGYLDAGIKIANYLPSAYDSAYLTVGKGFADYINAWIIYDPNQAAAGWYYPGQKYNDIVLNLGKSSWASYYGGVAAHETTHLLFDYSNTLYYQDKVANSWVTEALAWYAGDTLFPYGDRHGYSYYSDLLDYYSNDGKERATWYDSGGRYNGLLSGGMSALDYAQVVSIGYFLVNSTSKSISAVWEVVDNLGKGMGLDDAFSAVYGMPTGHRSTDSGEGVNTLYSEYLKYYLGHY